MNDIVEVRHAVDRLLEGQIEPLLDLLGDGVELEVVEGGEAQRSRTAWGKQAVADYFAALGGLTAFWQIDYGAVNGEVIAWGKERFTIQGCELEGECEFALVFGLSEGRIVRLRVAEDLASFVRSGTLPPVRAVA